MFSSSYSIKIRELCGATVDDKYYVTRMGNSNLTNDIMRVESIKRQKSSVHDDCEHNCYLRSGQGLRTRLLPHLHNEKSP